MRKHISTIAFLAICAGLTAPAQVPEGGVSKAGLGPKAVQSFNLDRPEARPELEPGKLNTSLPAFPSLSRLGDVLPVKNGRVQLYSVSRLGDDDLRNPFEIRVQVAVEMVETVFEIGGIVEGRQPSENTVILLLTPPETRDPGTEEEAQEGQGTQGAQAPAKKAPPPRPQQRQKISAICSLGDIVQGYRIQHIDREGIIVERENRRVHIPRDNPITISVPLTLR